MVMFAQNIVELRARKGLAGRRRDKRKKDDCAGMACFSEMVPIYFDQYQLVDPMCVKMTQGMPIQQMKFIVRESCGVTTRGGSFVSPPFTRNHS